MLCRWGLHAPVCYSPRTLAGLGDGLPSVDYRIRSERLVGAVRILGEARQRPNPLVANDAKACWFFMRLNVVG